MKIKKLAFLPLVIVLAYFTSSTSTYAEGTSTTSTTESTSTSTESTSEKNYQLTDISGTYRLSESKRINLTDDEDPLKDFPTIKGKFVIERLNDTTFLAFSAITTKGAKTLPYVDIIEFTAEGFKKKLMHMEDEVGIANVEIDNSKPDELTITTLDDEKYQEINTWKKIDPTTEKKDKYLEKQITAAKQQFEEFGLAKYKVMRTKPE